MVKVALLDRDGVLSRDRPDYVKNEEELEVFGFAAGALARLRACGWLIYIVSNQSGVGRGIMTEADEERITAKLVREVGPLDGVFYCFHKPEDECDCRKPAPGLLLKALAAAAARGPATERWMVGDAARDVAAGRRAGCKTAVVLTGGLTAPAARALVPPPDLVVANLSAWVDVVTGRERIK